MTLMSLFSSPSRRALTPRSLTILATISYATIASTMPAQALISEKFDAETPQAKAVVSEQIGADGAKDGNCTGTAIADHWVVTARHCIENADKPGGSVRIGQGNEQTRVDIDNWYAAPKGDVALIHTAQSIGLDSYPELANSAATNDKATAYGWSSDGSGKTTRLPVGNGKITELSPFAMFDGEHALNAELTDGAEFQAGDSGGPLFVDNKLAGVLTASFNPDDPEAASSKQALFAAVSDAEEWIKQTMADKDSHPEETSAAREAKKDNHTLWLTLGGVAVVAILFIALRMSQQQKDD